MGAMANPLGLRPDLFVVPAFCRDYLEEAGTIRVSTLSLQANAECPGYCRYAPRLILRPDLLEPIFLQTIHIAAYVVHAARLKKLLDHTVEGLLLLFGGKHPSIAFELCAQVVGHARSLAEVT